MGRDTGPLRSPAVSMAPWGPGPGAATRTHTSIPDYFCPGWEPDVPALDMPNKQNRTPCSQGLCQKPNGIGHSSGVEAGSQRNFGPPTPTWSGGMKTPQPWAPPKTAT